MSRNHFKERKPMSDTDSPISRCGRQETAKVAFDPGLQVEHLIHGIETCTTQSLQQGVRGHGAGVPVARFDLGERVADPAVITLATGSDNIQALADLTDCD